MPYAPGVRACSACLSVFASEPEFCVFDGQRLGEANDTLLGRALGGYRFTKLIGVGGTGCVFSGVEISTGMPCALKLLYGEMATDDSVAERIKREVDAVRSIDHPNVVKILDAGESPAGLPYMVMELIDGPTLKTIIEDEAPLHPRRAGRLAEQLVAGLAEAHHQGFVHRDLKPGNIIIGRDEHGAEHAKILDFGIVASLQLQKDEQRLTKTGYIVGTPTYMAPEQVDPKSVSPQADVYALGVILYELLAGKPPFNGSLEQILIAKMTQDPAPLPQAGELGQLVLKMLESNPKRRPPNALRISAELSRISLLSEDAATVRADAFATLPDSSLSTSSVHLIDRTVERDSEVNDSEVNEWAVATRKQAPVHEVIDTTAPDTEEDRGSSQASTDVPALLVRGDTDVVLPEYSETTDGVTAATIFSLDTEEQMPVQDHEQTTAEPVRYHESNAEAETSALGLSHSIIVKPPSSILENVPVEPAPVAPIAPISSITPMAPISRAKAGTPLAPAALLDIETDEDGIESGSIDDDDTAFNVPLKSVQKPSEAPTLPPPIRGKADRPAVLEVQERFSLHSGLSARSTPMRPLMSPPAPEDPDIPQRPAWLVPTAVVLLLTLSALVGFILASQRETALVDAPTLPLIRRP